MKINILDCTLRDGGYYTNWDFDVSMVKDMLDSLSSSGVTYIELGYKSPSNIKGFYGLFRFCSESQLRFLEDYHNLKFAFMVDTKEFCKKDNSIDYEKLKIIKPKKKSLFSMVRIASYNSLIEQSCDLCTHFKNLGYEVTFNFMGVSLLNEKDIEISLVKISNLNFDIVYFADSFGNFYPEDIEKYIKLFKKYWIGKLGFHAHDNQGMAFSNTITALKYGVDFIDATLLGMGRGAGNLKLEQILPVLYFKQNLNSYNALALIDVVEKYFIPLKKQYQWGWNYSYMLSGLKNIHPTYCQKLKSNHQYTMYQVSEILSNILDKNKKSFDNEALIEATERVLQNQTSCINKNINIDKLTITKQYKKILLVAGGNSSIKYKSLLHAFVKKEKPFIIECNNTNLLNDYERIVAILNDVRLKEFKDKADTKKVENIIFSKKFIAEQMKFENLKYLPYKLDSGKFSFEKDLIVISEYLVGMFAMGLALLFKPEIIYIAGFDGFADNNKNKEMQVLFDTLKDNSTRIISIFHTNYKNIEVKSIFSFLD